MKEPRQRIDLSVYFVADPSLCEGRDVSDVVRQAIDGGATLIQFRDKENQGNVLEDLARAVLKTVRESGTDVLCLMNDHVDLCQALDADGVHIGQGDMKPKQARDLLGPDKVIGLTAFTEEHINALDREVVDYIGTGPFYETRTDKGKPVLGAQRFASLAAMSPVPVVGIGGITAENCADVIGAGADGVAMMRAISVAPDPEKAARAISNSVAQARLRRVS